MPEVWILEFYWADIDVGLSKLCLARKLWPDGCCKDDYLSGSITISYCSDTFWPWGVDPVSTSEFEYYSKCVRMKFAKWVDKSLMCMFSVSSGWRCRKLCNLTIAASKRSVLRNSSIICLISSYFCAELMEFTYCWLPKVAGYYWREVAWIPPNPGIGLALGYSSISWIHLLTWLSAFRCLSTSL